MNGALQSLLVVVFFSLVGTLFKQCFGIAGKTALAGVVLLSSISIAIVAFRLRARLNRDLARMAPEELARYREECRKAGLDDPLEEMTKPELTGLGNVVDLSLGLLSAFGPPAIYHVASGRALSWNAEVTGWHLLCMAAGVGLYSSVRKRVVRPFVRIPGGTAREHGA